jgi:succinyl-CoA synthetase beta subunit
MPIANCLLPNNQQPTTNNQYMDLLEYQAKELFNQVGIPVLPSQKIEDPRDLKHLQIPYPIVLKSQVRVGGRGRAGGIRFVENTIDAIAAARAIFNLPILGQYPEVLLAEAQYAAEKEFFLAVVLDYQLQRPVLLGSLCGGIDIEALLENLQMVVVEDEFSPFYARRLTIKMGIAGSLIEPVSSILEKMYRLFRDKDLDLVEINPLGVSTDGKLMALDSKITVNDCALARHPEIISLTTPKQQHSEDLFTSIECKTNLENDSSTEPKIIHGADEKGNIGIICNNFALTMMSWDLIAQDRGKVSLAMAIGNENSTAMLPSLSIVRQLEKSLNRMMEIKELKVVLVNILANSEIIEAVSNTIVNYLQLPVEQTLKQTGEERIERPTGAVSRSRRENTTSSSSSKHRSFHQPQLVIRLVGGNIESIEEAMANLSVKFTLSLEEAIAQTLALAKAR